ncbi:hypothetical protein QUF80_09735 [Desulfococcaceae bacterium HSG8]|nr:hypothetical protein [Desulfococcaceae bacterium HSG8]
MVGSAGDSYLFIFSTPIEAVHFALRTQLLHRQARAGEWYELPEFRIGIHMGEVIVEQGTEPGKISDIK